MPGADFSADDTLMHAFTLCVRDMHGICDVCSIRDARIDGFRGTRLRCLNLPYAQHPDGHK